MTKPKVAIIGTRGYPSYYGGFETAVRQLAPYLAAKGWDVTVYGRPGATRADDVLSKEPVRTIATPGIERKSLSTLTYGLTSTFHAACILKPDVALVMNVANGYALPLLRFRGIPTLVNVDGIEWERAKWGKLAKAVFRGGARATARWASNLVFDARAIGQRWKRDFGRDGVFIPYGGDPVEQADPVKNLVPRRYVLYVARFVPENSVDAFLAAVPSIAEHADVVVVGSSGYGGEFDERAQHLSETHDRVHWLGHVSDDRMLHSLWKHAGAYFHGHTVGGTNPALVQAMAAGAPTVARDTVYNREVLQDAGLFVPGDSASISSALLALLANPVQQEQMSAASCERADAEYTWEAVCQGYEAALRDLLSIEGRPNDGVQKNSDDLIDQGSRGDR
ncbi:glycosyltransferase [Microbacterium caowuchunii]|uniref:glycosyltransferase n=1 Tax=Microbacterium caowuchunii TaxID=2614638 RepID=UPI001CD560C2|nr:glycosyltransferase [Microbacterium caowuchunii]